MENRKKNFIIIGIIISAIVICGIITGVTMFILKATKNTDEGDFYEFIEVIEGKEEYISHVWGIFLGGICSKGETLTFSFDTNPNGLIEVYLEVDDVDIALLIGKSVDNYKIIVPENDCTLYFMNLEVFNIILTLNFTVK